MKVVVALILASALLVENVYPLPLALMSPLGLGLGLGYPLGLGLGLGFPFMGFGLGLGRVGFRRFGLRRLGRDAEVDEKAERQVAEHMEKQMANKTICSYESVTGLLQCASISASFECQVEERLPGLENVNIRLADLEIVPAVPKQFDVLKVLSRASSGLFTFIQPGTTKQITVSLFNSDKITEPGLFVKDSTCWSQFQRVISESKPEDVGFALTL